MHQLQPLLEQIGMNHHESAVYLQLLSFGEAPASVVARKTHIPRSTVRNVLDKLCERGVVRKIYKRNTQYYSCSEPLSLLKHLERRVTETKQSMNDVREALPLLAALHRGASVAPKVRFFEGREGVIEAFNHSLFVEDIDEILFFTSYRFLREPAIQKNDDDFYIPLRVKKGIKLRVLVGRTERNDKFSKKNTAELRQRRFFPDEYALPGNFHIYGDYVVYFSAGDDEYIAILVESAMMAKTMRALFEFIWAQCK